MRHRQSLFRHSVWTVGINPQTGLYAQKTPQKEYEAEAAERVKDGKAAERTESAANTAVMKKPFCRM